MWSFVHRVCVCVCVCVREREREREKERGSQRSVVCMCACVCESGRRSRITMAACVQSHTSIITVSVSRLCSPLGLELMVKPRTLLTVFTLILKAKAGDFGKGRYISDVACGVWPITMHWVNWPIRADCACRKEGLCRKRREAEYRGPTILCSIWKISFLNIKACQHILLHKIIIFKKASYDPFLLKRCFCTAEDHKLGDGIM